MADEPLVSPEEMASVLSTDGDGPNDVAEPGSTVYSLRRPVAIAPADEAAARARLEGFAATLQDVICRELDAEFTMGVQGFQQEQAGAAVRSLPQPAWILSFLHVDGGGLGLALDPTCGLALVEVALGGAGSTSASSRAPTPLEARVLAKLSGALAARLGEATGQSFSEGRFDCETLPFRLATSGQTVAVGLLELSIAETKRGGAMLATANLLREPEETEVRDRDSLTVGPLAAGLERVNVEVRPVLPAGTVSFSDLVALEPDSVLRLEAEESRPLELRLEGEPVFRGGVERADGPAAFRVAWRRGRRRVALQQEEA